MPAEENRVMSFFREELKAAHQLLEGTIEGVTNEQALWAPPGIALPIGATYAHIVLSEDGTMNGMFKGGAPFFASSWAGKTGVSEMQPAPNPKTPGFPDWSGWGRRVKIDLAQFRPYARAVYAATDEFLASLTDEDLRRPVSLAFIGLGESTWEFVLINGVLGNALTHSGEISCLKGLQGKRGYPF
jgi:hypothetical protein